MHTYLTVPVLDIDLDEKHFCFSLSLNDESLAASVSSVGILQPVTLLKKGNGYTVLSGFRRLNTAVRLGVHKIPCKILDLPEYSDKRLWEYVINDNFLRKLSDIEKSELVSRAYDCKPGNMEWVVSDLLPMLGLEKSRKTFDELLSASSLLGDIKALAHEKGYPLRFLYAISRFAPAGQEALFWLLSKIPCGHNKVSALVTWLGDIAERDGCSIEDILAKPSISESLNSPDLAPSKKFEIIKTLLYSMRFPGFYKLETDFDEKIKSLSLGRRVSLLRPKFMEGRLLAFQVNVSTSSELADAARKLLDISKNYRIESYFFWGYDDDR